MDVHVNAYARVRSVTFKKGRCARAVQYSFLRQPLKKKFNQKRVKFFPCHSPFIHKQKCKYRQ